MVGVHRIGTTIMWNYWNLLDLGLVFDAAMILPIALLTKVSLFLFHKGPFLYLTRVFLDTSGCPAVIPGNYFTCG